MMFIYLRMLGELDAINGSAISGGVPMLTAQSRGGAKSCRLADWGSSFPWR